MDPTLNQLVTDLFVLSNQLQQVTARVKELETELATRPPAEPKDPIDKPSAGLFYAQPQAENGSAPSNKPAWAP